MPIYVQDKRLPLPSGRTLAYADNGNTSSSTVLLFLHGAFSVGDASRLSPVHVEKHVHLVTPTLPGWGETSPVPHPSQYAATLISDIQALLAHLHQNDPKLKLYLCGHSIGCIAAQILYGAPYDIFPFGRRIAGLILLAPSTPPHCHKDYAKLVSWSSYFMTGPASQYIPFNLLARLTKCLLTNKLKEEHSAELFVRTAVFNTLTDSESETFARWRDVNGIGEGQLEREWAGNAVRSVAQTWQGFLDMAAVYHSGWGGFCPHTLDEEHSKPPVIIITCTNDATSPKGMAEWMSHNYTHATLKIVEGGLLAAYLTMDQVWRDILQ